MMYRLRVSTLKDSASLAVYRDVHYPRHFGSFTVTRGHLRDGAA